MNQAIIYTKDNCIESERLKSLIRHLGVSHLEYKLGKDYNEKQFVSEFGKNAEYPQVAVDIKHIGGLKDFLQFLKSKNQI
tara:strand:- start:206 stop:445 length:240 start_codon:yes stop_codon:yes gene_type:complete